MSSSWPRFALQKLPEGSAVPHRPLTWAAPLSSLSVTAEPTIDTQDNPRHWPYVLNIAISCLKQAVWILPLICAHVPSPLFFYYLL